MNKNSFSIQDYFIKGTDKKQKKMFYRLIDECFDFISGKTRDFKVLNYRTPKSLKDEFVDTVPEDGVDYDNIFKTLRYVGEYSIAQSDLNYLAFPDSGNSVAGMMGDVYSKFLNQNLIAFDRSAPIATFIEIQVMEWLRELLGYDFKKVSEITSLSEVSGVCTSGGHMSNHLAIMTALNHKYEVIKSKGLSGLTCAPKIILAGKISHYSVSSAMHHLGLGSDNIISVESNSDFTTNTESLDQLLSQHREQNDVFMVVAVAGNTRTSSIDDLEQIHKICEKYGVWMHVDACHGGSLLFSNKLKGKYLRGIECADSVSVDPHKGMFVTYPLSFILFKRRGELVKFTRYKEQVGNGEAWDLGYISPFFGSRGFESLKLWLMIKSLGRSGLERVVEKREQEALFVASLLEKSGLFCLFHDMTFYRLVFVYLPNEVRCKIVDGKRTVEIDIKLKNCIDYYTHKINQELYEEGLVCLDEFKLHDLGNKIPLNFPDDRYMVMSVTVGNPLYSKKSLSKSLGYLFDKARLYSVKMQEDVDRIINGGNYETVAQQQSGPAGWK